MPEEKDSGGGFRVVDRRGFSADGTRRQVEPEKTEKAVPPASPEPPPSPVPSVEEVEGRFEEAGAGFDTLVSYLSTTAMFQLGLLAGPSGERIPPDFVNARRTIDLMEVLQQKTQGNLTADEARLLEDVLYDLRLTYIEIQKRLTAKAK